ncbi:MAG: hypothetical protein PWQ37_332 [Candidatus Petromonas sp.]|jgi:hypothetical protein|nr:hypothetical protein [Candidatus Petromonas sp.]
MNIYIVLESLYKTLKKKFHKKRIQSFLDQLIKDIEKNKD